jgi:threonine 3-dehydrogenase
VFHDAVQSGVHECYLKPDTRLPMMYIDDCLKSVIKFMEYPETNLKQRVYNVNAMSFTPDELFAEVKKYVPDLEIKYKVDPIRQSIADSWPQRFDDQNAKRDWEWQPEYDLNGLVLKMFTELKKSKQWPNDADWIKNIRT